MSNPWTCLRRYPALLCLYGAGIAAIASGNYATVFALLRELKWEKCGQQVDAVTALLADHVLFGDFLRKHVLPSDPGSRFQLPITEHLIRALRAPLHEFVLDYDEHPRAVDRFEYFLALVQADRNEAVSRGIGRFSIGRWVFSFDSIRLRMGDATAPSEVDQEADREGPRWGPLQAGFFGGRLERLKEVRQEVGRQAAEIAESLGFQAMMSR